MTEVIAGFTIRGGRATDLDALERIEDAAFQSDRLSRRSLRYYLAAASTDVPVAEDRAGLVGYAMIGFRRSSRIGRIFSLAVDSGQGRRGIGRALLDACEARAAARGSLTVRLEVRTDNAAAIALYEAAGYTNFATFADYYEDGASALRFGKQLVPVAATGRARPDAEG